jgi:squalene-hopene/tetraprenyl-beta-curcumene cyclase
MFEERFDMPRMLPVLSLFLLSGVMLCLGTELAAQTVGPKAEDLAKSRIRAANFLKTTQATDGSWTSPQAPGISGLVTFSLLQAGVPASDPVVDKALKHLETYIQPDGGIYFPKSHHSNYETAICLLAFNAANQNGKYDNLIKQAERFLRKLQWDDSEQCDQSDPKYGGAGYGAKGDRPDLSNTTFFLDALQAAGATKDDPAVQKALVFLSRCQNLESEFNTTPFPSKVNDGGFYYTPAAGGNSQAGNTENGGLRSYASMTYAGLKSMIFAGLTPEDKRVKAALEWITKHYTVEENPGLGQQGVYYYFQVFAKSLAALKLDYAKDEQGKLHDWRKELAEHLFSLQKDNGAWLNKNERWYEGDPNLATAYVLMALKYCDPVAVSSK